jgi:hypothetical protein
MIANANELEVAVHNLQSVENALNALRKEMLVTNPALFPVVAQTYTRRIRSLQDDIFAYLNKNLAVSPVGEETVKGILISIDIERNTCRIRPEGEGVVSCGYAEDIENALITAVKKQVEVSGVIVPFSRTSDLRRIRHIERLRVLDA